MGNPLLSVNDCKRCGQVFSCYYDSVRNHCHKCPDKDDCLMNYYAEINRVNCVCPNCAAKERDAFKEKYEHKVIVIKGGTDES